MHIIIIGHGIYSFCSCYGPILLGPCSCEVFHYVYYIELRIVYVRDWMNTNSKDSWDFFFIDFFKYMYHTYNSLT